MTEKMPIPIPVRAAQASWVLPLGALGLSLVASAITGDEPSAIGMALGGVGVLMGCAGMLLALLAFTGVPKHGTRGVVLPAICGIVLCSTYLGLLVLTLAQKKQAEQDAAPPVDAAHAE